MATLRDIRNRIKSIKNTEQITKAMKMVSAAKFRRVQELAVSGREYYLRVNSITRNLARLAGPSGHLLFHQGEEKNIDLIVFTSDKGLCGSFNANLIKTASSFIENHPSSTVNLIAVGKKGRDFFHHLKVSLAGEYIDISRSIGLPLARQMAANALDRFKSGQADSTYIIYSRFFSVVNQKPTLIKLFPIPPADVDETPSVQYLYEPSRADLIDCMVPLYTDINLYQSLLETAASEHGARMSAMDTATKNAGELIGKLTLYYNRARQAAITKELIEVVSGADALEA